MTSVLEALAFATQKFMAQGNKWAAKEAEEILCSVLHCNCSLLYANVRRVLTEDEWALCQAYVARRLKGEPLAYIQGEIDFFDCLIRLSPAVLIPRQETEILVDKIASELARQDFKGKILWDLCCGSGCIGIALKKRFPDLSVVLADLSSDALSLAHQNALSNGVEVSCLQGDLLAPFKGEKAHYCVSNPPYVSEAEFSELDREVREFEPKLALVGGVSGLEFYERLAKELPSHLYPQAKVWFEIGYQQGEALQELFQSPSWKRQRLENDWAGHHRFFFLENE